MFASFFCVYLFSARWLFSLFGICIYTIFTMMDWEVLAIIQMLCHCCAYSAHSSSAAHSFAIATGFVSLDPWFTMGTVRSAAVATFICNPRASPVRCNAIILWPSHASMVSRASLKSIHADGRCPRRAVSNCRTGRGRAMVADAAAAALIAVASCGLAAHAKVDVDCCHSRVANTSA